MITYRNTLGRPLTAIEVDENFRTLSERIDVLADPDPSTQPSTQPSGLPDAPRDDKLYGRRNGSWSVVVTAAGISDAPSDGKSYVRKDGAWAVAASGGGSGGGNLRYVGEWSSSLNIQRLDVVEHDNMMWIARDNYGTQAPAPSFGQDGYWLPMGFPGAYTAQPSSSRIQHKFSTAHENSQADLATILNDLETRLKALEG